MENHLILGCQNAVGAMCNNPSLITEQWFPTMIFRSQQGSSYLYPFLLEIDSYRIMVRARFVQGLRGCVFKLRWEQQYRNLEVRILYPMIHQITSSEGERGMRPVKIELSGIKVASGVSITHSLFYFSPWIYYQRPGLESCT